MTGDLLLQYQTLIFERQLQRQIISCILTGIAIALAFIIGIKQIKITKRLFEFELMHKSSDREHKILLDAIKNNDKETINVFKSIIKTKRKLIRNHLNKSPF